MTLNQVKDMRYLRIMSNVDVDSTDGFIPKWTEAISCLPRMTIWIHMLMFYFVAKATKLQAIFNLQKVILPK